MNLAKRYDRRKKLEDTLPTAPPPPTTTTIREARLTDLRTPIAEPRASPVGSYIQRLLFGNEAQVSGIRAFLSEMERRTLAASGAFEDFKFPMRRLTRH